MKRLNINQAMKNLCSVGAIICLGVLSACNLLNPKIELETVALISAAEGGRIESADGSYWLDIPAGALEKDMEIGVEAVSMDDVPDELRALAGEHGDPQAEVFAYRLEPDGLEFDEPVTVTFVLGEDALSDGEIAGQVLLSQGDRGNAEVLQDVEVVASLDKGTVTVNAQISHFSYLVRTKNYLKATLEQVEPKDQEVGARFNVEVVLENTDAEGYQYEEIESSLSTYGPVEIIEYNPASGAGNIDGPTFTRLRNMAGTLFPRRSKGEFLDLKCVDPGIASYTFKVTAKHVFAPANQPFTDDTYLLRTINISLTAVVNCVAPPTATPTLTFTPPIPLITDTPFPTLTPTETLTPTLTPTATPIPTATPVQIGGTVNVGSVNCRHGPSSSFLYKYGLSQGEQVMAFGMFSGWLLVQPEFYPGPCWIWNALLDLDGDYTTLPYTNYIGYMPREYEFANQVTGLTVKRQGNNLIFTWNAAGYIATVDFRGYFLALNACLNGLILPQFYQTEATTITILVDTTCGQSSTLTFYVVHKDGYGPELNTTLP